jgi:methyl-accepting chemotaxis protein
MLGALEQKESALSSRFSTLPGLQLDAALAQKRARDQRKKLQEMYDKYGITGDLRNIGYTEAYNMGINPTVDRVQLNKAYSEMRRLEGIADEARRSYEEQANALEEAKQAIEEYRQAINEMPGDVEKAATASEKFWKDNADNIKIVFNAAQEAIKAMDDYATGVHESSKKAVDSVAHGLDAVSYSTYKTANENIDNIKKQINALKEGTDEWKEKHTGLEKELEKYNNQLITTDSIYKNLQTQADFLGDYLNNISQAREMGLDENLLAELSDGSVESAQYLDAIVNSQTGTTIDDINKKYREITEAKSELAKELANQQLSVDQTYQTLAEKAKEAVDSLDQSIPAGEKTGSTMQSIADAIGEHIPDVAAQVDGMLAELNRLNGYGISIDFGGFGKITFNVSSGETAQGSRMGLDFVPHDGYLARLHEGERVLTAQENEIWNALRGGGVAGFSLDDLGGVMRDNVKPGGNVYLDSRIVGSVISEQQGKSYRQLKRSGWQS